jgi:hypothetical protein
MKKKTANKINPKFIYAELRFISLKKFVSVLVEYLGILRQKSLAIHFSEALI